MRALLLCLLLALASPATAAPTGAECCIAWLRARLWVREATGHNDGPAVAAIIAANNGNPRDEWCGHTQADAQRSCGLPVPKGSGGSYNWFLDRVRTFYLVGVRGTLDAIQPGHLVGIYSPKRGRIAHITRAVQVVPPLRKGRPPRGFYCIGGNEGSGTNAGMHLTYYPSGGIHAAANWSN